MIHGVIAQEAKEGARAKIGTVYALIYQGSVRYIGFTTKSLAERKRRHIDDAKGGRKRRVCQWLASLRKDDLPIIWPLAYPATIWDEHRFVSAYEDLGADLLNQTKGGPGTFGRRKTDAERIRQSQISKAAMRDPVARAHLSESAKRQWAADNSSLRSASAHPDAIAKRAAANRERWAKTRNAEMPIERQKALVESIRSGHETIRGAARRLRISRDKIKTLMRVHAK